MDRGIFRIRNVRSLHLRNIIEVLNFARGLKLSEPNFLHLNTEVISNKQDIPITDTKNRIIDPITMLLPRSSDRIFPLDTVEIKSFNEKHGRNLNKATIHIGERADFYTRFWNLLAFVVDDHIYFRSNKFNTTTEEGRMLLGHELTHVVQKENRENKDKEELELEARQAENWETIDPDPPEKITLCGTVYFLRKKEQKKIIHKVANGITNWIKSEKQSLGEFEYLKLLISYEEMITGYKTICLGRTEADRWMDRELKKELKWRAGL